MLLLLNTLYCSRAAGLEWTRLDAFSSNPIIINLFTYSSGFFFFYLCFGKANLMPIGRLGLPYFNTCSFINWSPGRWQNGRPINHIDEKLMSKLKQAGGRRDSPERVSLAQSNQIMRREELEIVGHRQGEACLYNSLMMTLPETSARPTVFAFASHAPTSVRFSRMSER